MGAGSGTQDLPRVRLVLCDEPQPSFLFYFETVLCCNLG